jgi:uncharacterized protein YoxC
MMRKKFRIKPLIWCLCFQLLVFSFPAGKSVKADSADTEGFIIEADRVIGENMTANLVYTETSGRDKAPMLRFHYSHATIYGMKLTKRFNTPKGPISLTMEARGPVTMNGMTVDASGISFKGACLHASKTIPQAGLENVVMQAHFMTADSSNLEQLLLQTVSGKQGPGPLPKTQILEDLAFLPVNQIGKEIDKITKGQMPLTCSDEKANKKAQGKIIDIGKGLIPGELPNPIDRVTDGIGGVTDPLEDTVGSITEPVDRLTEPVTKPLDETLKPVRDQLKPVTDQLKPVTDNLKPVTENVKKVTKHLKPVTKAVKPVTEKLKPVKKEVEKQVKKATEPVITTTEQACQRLSEANGKITKDLALGLVNQALKEDKGLTELCGQNKAVTEELKNVQEELADTLNLDSLLNILEPENEQENLEDLKEKLLKEEDGLLFKILP